MRRAIIRQMATTHSILTPRKYTTFVNSGQVQSKQIFGTIDLVSSSKLSDQTGNTVC